MSKNMDSEMSSEIVEGFRGIVLCIGPNIIIVWFCPEWRSNDVGPYSRRLRVS